MSTIAPDAADRTAPRRPRPGGTASWACHPGFPPATIFPFTPPERIGIRNLYEFQSLMFRPLYWPGKDGRAEVDEALSLAEPPEWDADGLSVTVRLKPWQWSNGEPICADNVMFWVNMMAVKGERYGKYVPGLIPDNLTSYQKISESEVRFTFDRVYNRTWVQLNQLSLITPMPRAWDRFSRETAANASADLADIPGVYDYLVSENGAFTAEDNELRTRWPDSPVWSVVSGPWRLNSFSTEGVISFVPNENYSGPNKPKLTEFRQIPTPSDEDLFARLQAGPDHSPTSVDVGYLPYGLDPKLTEGDPDPLREHYRLVPQDVVAVNYMPMNFGNSGFAGRLVRQAYARQALQSCLDQPSAIRDIFAGHGRITDGPVPVVGGYLPPKPQRWPFDLDRARALLTDNGWDVSSTPAVCVRPGEGPGGAGAGIEAGDRFTLHIRYVEGKAALTQLLEMFAADAARAGIELVLEPIYGSVMVAEDHTEGGAGNKLWELNSWNGGWVFDGYPTGEMVFATGAGSNWAKYSDPTADELIRQTLLSNEPDALQNYQDYLAEQVPAVWTPGFPMRLMEVAHDLRGVEPVNPFGMINPENWYFVDESDTAAVES